MFTSTTRIITALSLLLTFSLLIDVSSTEPLQSPLRLRVNTALMKDPFFKRDQEILNLFQDLTLLDSDMKNGYQFYDSFASIVPASGKFEDFDFDLSLDEKKFKGVSSDKLKFTCTGGILKKDTRVRDRFEITGPIDELRVIMDIVKNGTSKTVKYEGVSIKLDQSKFQIKALDNAQVIEENSDKIKKWIHDELVNLVQEIKEDLLAGSRYYIRKLPILNISPMSLLLLLTSKAENVEFSNDFIEVDFSPKSLTLIDEMKTELMKPIDTSFGPLDQGKEPVALQAIVDENFFNVGFQYLISSTQRFSLREFMSKDPRFAIFRQLLTTTTIGMVLQSFKEDYGDGKAVDIISFVNHNELLAMFEGIQPSGFSIDSKGNFKVFINIGAQIIIETEAGQWEDARKLVFTFGMRGRIFVEDAEFENKTLNIQPKGFELSTLKIFKGDEEQFLEQMLAQSLIGVQLDQLKRGLKTQTIPLKKFENPIEFECFGFNFTTVDVLVKQNYLQFNANYLKIDTPYDEEYCQEIESMIKDNPHHLFELFRSYAPEVSQLFEKFKESDAYKSFNQRGIDAPRRKSTSQREAEIQGEKQTKEDL